MLQMPLVSVVRLAGMTIVRTFCPAIAGCDVSFIGNLAACGERLM